MRWLGAWPTRRAGQAIADRFRNPFGGYPFYPLP
jgi:hypothetical protein